MIVSIVDYGIGNLHSLAKGLSGEDREVRIDTDMSAALEADALVLPGVGNFGAAAARLQPARASLRDALRDGKPCIGICLGMQLLFETSEEGEGSGIGAIPGRVRRLHAARVPHMGWNDVDDTSHDALFTEARPMVAYYANSYVCEPDDPEAVIAWTDYGDERWAAAVRRGRTWGVQFHPEKSGAPGLRVLQNFLREAGT
jgi:imidazole glycerol-phosphate synthase subunit HisH